MAILVLGSHWQGLCDTSNDYDKLTPAYMQRYVIDFSKSNMSHNFITSFLPFFTPKDARVIQAIHNRHLKYRISAI